MLHITMPLKLINCLIKKTTLLFPFKDFHASEVVSAIEDYRCTSLLGSARMLFEVINLIEARETKCSSIQNVFVAGSMVNFNLVDLYVKKLGVKYFGSGYGMTEALYAGMNHAILNDYDRDQSSINSFTLLPYFEAKVVDQANGQILPLGSDGILCLRSYAIMAKYWDEPVKTKEVLDENGWLATGDVACMSEDGRITVQGRQKETIKICKNHFSCSIQTPIYITFSYFRRFLHLSFRD